jgi:hypothetical protein
MPVLSTSICSGVAFKQRCTLGRSFTVLTAISGCVGIGLSIKQLDQVGARTFRTIISGVGFVCSLVCCLVVVAFREASFDLDNSLCGTSGEWSYGLSFILFSIAMFLNIASGIVAYQTQEDLVPAATLAKRRSRESLKRLSQNMVKAPVRRPSDMLQLNQGGLESASSPAIIYKPGMRKSWNEGFSH